MGCTTSKGSGHKVLRVHTRCGSLKITILNCHLQRNTNAVMTMDPYVKIKVSNQTKQTQIRKKGGYDPQFDANFEFNINSCYKNDGRSLQLFVMDHNVVEADKVIGYGLIDLDPIIQHDETKHQIKVRLNFDCQSVGYLNLRAQFIEEVYDTLTFRFETVDIKRRTSLLGTMNCWVRLTIGEEVLQTAKSKDTVQSPPIWNQQMFVILIPKSIKYARVQVFDDKKLVGDSQIPLEVYTATTQQRSYKEIIRLDNIESAILEFSVVAGQRAQMSADKKVYRKSTYVEKGPQQKAEIPKQGENIAKKEESVPHHEANAEVALHPTEQKPQQKPEHP